MPSLSIIGGDKLRKRKQLLKPERETERVFFLHSLSLSITGAIMEKEKSVPLNQKEKENELSLSAIFLLLYSAISLSLSPKKSTNKNSRRERLTL